MASLRPSENASNNKHNQVPLVNDEELDLNEIPEPTLHFSVHNQNIIRFIKDRQRLPKSDNDLNSDAFQDIDINDVSRDPLHEQPSFINNSPLLVYLRVLKTLCLGFAFFGLGITSALFGPSLFDLAYKTRSQIHDMSFVFTARSVGYLIGSVAGGWLYDKLDGYLVIGLVSLLGALFSIVMPLVGNIYGLIFVACLASIGNGALDTDGNALMLLLWPGHGPYMQLLHFTFAVGSFFSPLLVKPFLLPDSITNPDIYSPTDNTSGSLNVTGNSVTEHSIGAIPLTWAYIIGSFPQLAAGVVFLCFAFFKSCKEEYVKKEKRIVASSGQSGAVYKAVILTMFFFLFLLYVGMETGYGGFIFTFAVKAKPSMTKSSAANLNSGYWGSFAFARLLSVPLAKYVKPGHMIIGDFIGTTIAAGILVSMSSQGCDAASIPRLWAGTIILGMSAASVFPAALSWAELFLDVSGKTASVFLVGACVGDMAVPLFVGNTITSIGPCTLPFSVLVLCCFCVLIFALISLFAWYHRSVGVTSGLGFHSRNKTELLEPSGPQRRENDMLDLIEN